MRLIRPAAFALALALPTLAGAAEPWTIDPSHTAILFEIDHLGFSTTHGSFRGFSGELALDEAAPANSSVRFTIDASSLDTHWAARDEHVRSADFLNVAAHPTIEFASTSVVTTGEKAADVTGDLTLNGVTKPVVLAVTLNQLGTNPVTQGKTAGFSATTSIKRSDFGITTYLPAIGDEISIQIELEATPTAK